MIGDQNFDAPAPGVCNACVTGNAVIDSDNESRRSGRGDRDDLWRESVAELEAVRHQEVYGDKAPRTQRSEHERSAGRAVGVKIANHEYPAGGAVLKEQVYGWQDSLERAHRQESLQRSIQLERAAYAASGIDALQDRMQDAGELRLTRGSAHHAQGHRRLSSTWRWRRQNFRWALELIARQRSLASSDTRAILPRRTASTAGAMKRRSSSASDIRPASTTSTALPSSCVKSSCSGKGCGAPPHDRHNPCR